jgi:hypothetical protein
MDTESVVVAFGGTCRVYVVEVSTALSGSFPAFALWIIRG